MLVIVAYYPADRAAPVIKFFVRSPSQGAEVAAYISGQVSLGMRVNTYKIDSIDDAPDIVYETTN